MNDATCTYFINGKKAIGRNGITVADAKQIEPLIGGDLLLGEDPTTGNMLRLGENDHLVPGRKYQTIPRIVKGTTAAVQPSLSPRLAAEVQLLRVAAGGRSKVMLGPKTTGGRQYTAVLVSNVRLNEKKFGVTTTGMLFLLPPDYPRLPPIGCYLNYKWKTADHHFTLQAHYGAPVLTEQGWYWYCIGLGGGFNPEGWSRSWRPAARPEDGHNLVTLFVAARYAISSD